MVSLVDFQNTEVGNKIKFYLLQVLLLFLITSWNILKILKFFSPLLQEEKKRLYVNIAIASVAFKTRWYFL